MALEQSVLDDGRPTFIRYYAWLRLVKYWASLRFDDLRWVDPAKAVLSDLGLKLFLERTKVTGPGKKVGTLIAFISRDAYFSADSWLKVGFELKQVHLSSARFMFPLPTKDLEGVRDIPGDYSDASAASQALFANLPGHKPSQDFEVLDYSVDSFSQGFHLLPPGAGLFWTEHSERNGLPTAAAALGYPDDTIRRLGRWQVGAVTEGYIRTTINIVSKVQQHLAAKVREKGEDFLDEASTLTKLSKFMRARGLGEYETKLLVDRLFGGPCAPAAAPGTPIGEHFREDTQPSDNELDQDPSDVGLTGQVSLAGVDKDTPAELLSGYVVSIVGRKRFRRLHHIARCGMLPGTDYKEFIWYGEALPIATLYDQVCARCWRTRSSFDAEAAGTSAEAASASSSGESDSV